jgi:hypothetical protein
MMIGAVSHVKKEAFTSVLGMVIIILAAVIVGTLTAHMVGSLGIAQGQGNLTAEQKAAICNPSNPKLKFVNETESRICGIPKTIKSRANATTGAEVPSPPPATSIA